MNVKPKPPKKKAKESLKKQLATPKKIQLTKMSVAKERTPTTASTKFNLTSTMKKILQVPPTTFYNLVAENRSSIISMLITESSNVRLDSPIFASFDEFQQDEDGLIEMIRGESLQMQQAFRYLSQKQQAAIKIQQLWRCYKTNKIVNNFLNKSSEPSLSSNIEKYLHKHVYSEQENKESCPSQNKPSSSSQRKIPFPEINFMRVSDLNHLLSRQTVFSRRKYDSESQFAKQQLNMDILNQEDYRQQASMYKQVYNRKQKQLGEYSKLVGTVMNDAKRILNSLCLERNTIKNGGTRKSISCEELVSTFKLKRYLKQSKQTKEERKSPIGSQQILKQLKQSERIEFTQDEDIKKRIQEQFKEQILNKVVEEPKKVTSIAVTTEVVEGICKKILRFALNNKQNPLKNLQVPIGMTPQELLKTYHNADQSEIEMQTDVLPGKLFEQFEKSYLKQAEMQALKQGKILTIEFKRYIHFHNQAIFDIINQAFQFQRKHGINGYVLPWKPNRMINETTNLQKSLISVIDYVLDCQDCHCGYLSEHFYKINPDLPNQLLMEVRGQKQLIAQMLDMKKQRQDWNNYETNQTFLLLDIDTIISEYLIVEAILQMNQL